MDMEMRDQAVEIFHCPELRALEGWYMILLDKQVQTKSPQNSRATILLMQDFLWLHEISDSPDFCTLIMPQGDDVLMHCLSISLLSADKFLK